jgi:hypothetical protein
MEIIPRLEGKIFPEKDDEESSVEVKLFSSSLFVFFS